MLISTFHFRKKQLESTTKPSNFPLRNNFNLSSTKDLSIKGWLDNNHPPCNWAEISVSPFANFKKLGD